MGDLWTSPRTLLANRWTTPAVLPWWELLLQQQTPSMLPFPRTLYHKWRIDKWSAARPWPLRLGHHVLNAKGMKLGSMQILNPVTHKQVKNTVFAFQSFVWLHCLTLGKVNMPISKQICSLALYLPWRNNLSNHVFFRDWEVREKPFAKSRIKTFLQEMNFLWFFKVCWD